MMTVCQTGMAHPSLSAMSTACKSDISREGLNDRFKEGASRFMKLCFEAAMRERIPGELKLDVTLFNNFEKVILADSSSWDIDPRLKDIFCGSGGDASSASCKTQIAYDIKTGRFEFIDIVSGTVRDTHYTSSLFSIAGKHGVSIFDKGYFKLLSLKNIDEQGGYYLTRLHIGTNLKNALTKENIDLETKLSSCGSDVLELDVILGEKNNSSTKCRLICIKASEEAEAKRKEKLRKESSGKKSAPSRKKLFLCKWTLLITNAPEDMLSTDTAYTFYTIRWQIELIFKQLKSVLNIDRSNTKNKHRLLCELYGKLIIAVMIMNFHSIYNITLWNTCKLEISFDKLYKRVQERLMTFREFLTISLTQGIKYICKELNTLILKCVKYKQKFKMNTMDKIAAFIK